MSSGKKGRTDLVTKQERRDKVKELMIKGKNPHAISKALSIAYETALEDVKYWQAYFTKLAMNNDYIAQKTALKVIEGDEEIKIVKQKYWDLLEEMEEKVKENKKSNKNKPLYFSTRMDLLKSVMSRIEAEQRLRKLFSPAELIKNNYVSASVFKQILLTFKSVIFELIPKNKQQYAVDRLKKINAKTLSGKEIIDAEFEEIK